MLYNTEEIARRVRVAIDQNADPEQLLSDEDIDTLTLEEIIRSHAVEAVRRVHMQAPVSLLCTGHDMTLSPEWDDVMEDNVYWEEPSTETTGTVTGWVQVPEDFMRLVVFEMSDWERAVYAAISPDDPRYGLQRSRRAGLRGTPQRPVCVLAVRPEGRVLEFYSCRSRSAVVTRAVYIPYPKVDSSGWIDISERCLTAVVYMCGALTLLSCGQADAAQLMERQAVDSMK